MDRAGHLTGEPKFKLAKRDEMLLSSAGVKAMAGRVHLICTYFEPGPLDILSQMLSIREPLLLHRLAKRTAIRTSLAQQ